MDTTSASPAPTLVELQPTTTAIISGKVPASELPNFFDRSFSTLAEVLQRQGCAMTGPAFARYHGPMGPTVDLEVGFPVAGSVEPDGDVAVGSLPGGRVGRLEHHGSYDELGQSWERLQRWITEQGLVPGTVIWEVYTTEPSPDMDPADLVTELYWLVGG